MGMNKDEHREVVLKELREQRLLLKDVKENTDTIGLLIGGADALLFLIMVIVLLK